MRVDSAPGGIGDKGEWHVEVDDEPGPVFRHGVKEYVLAGGGVGDPKGVGGARWRVGQAGQRRARGGIDRRRGQGGEGNAAEGEASLHNVLVKRVGGEILQRVPDNNEISVDQVRLDFPVVRVGDELALGDRDQARLVAGGEHVTSVLYPYVAVSALGRAVEPTDQARRTGRTGPVADHVHARAQGREVEEADASRRGDVAGRAVGDALGVRRHVVDEVEAVLDGKRCGQERVRKLDELVVPGRPNSPEVGSRRRGPDNAPYAFGASDGSKAGVP